MKEPFSSIPHAARGGCFESNKNRKFLHIVSFFVSLQLIIHLFMEPVARTNNAISMNLPNVNSGHGEVRDIPEGYMSLDEFGDLFHRKLDEAYAKLQSDSEQ